MIRPQPLVRLLFGLSQISLGPGDRIAGNIFVIVEIGCDRNQDRNRIGSGHRNSGAVGDRRSALRRNLRDRTVLHLAGDRFMTVGSAVDQQPVVPLRGYPVVLHRGSERNPERNPAPFGSRQPHDRHLIGKRSKHLPLITYPIDGVTDRSRGRSQIQIPVKIRNVPMPRKVQQQRTGRLIRHTVRGVQREILVAQVESLFVASFENQPSHFGQRFPGGRIDVVVRTSGPDRLFVELQLLASAAPVYHNAQAAVAQRKRLFPAGSGSVVPKGQRPGIRAGRQLSAKAGCAQ